MSNSWRGPLLAVKTPPSERSKWTHTQFTIGKRIASLERQLRGFRITLEIVIIGSGLLLLRSAVLEAQDSKAIRVRTLVIEDASGRERIVLAAPWSIAKGE